MCHLIVSITALIVTLGVLIVTLVVVSVIAICRFLFYVVSALVGIVQFTLRVVVVISIAF